MGSGRFVVKAMNALRRMSPPVTAGRHGSLLQREAGIGSRSARATSASNIAPTSRPCRAQAAACRHQAAKRSKPSSYARASESNVRFVETEWSRIPSRAIARIRFGYSSA